VRVVLIPPGELGSAEIAAWHSMQRTTPSLASPFLSPEFAVAVGRFWPQAEVAVLTEGQSITGFFPFERRRLGAGVPICGWLNSGHGLIHVPEAEWDPQQLLRGCRLSAWRFDNLVAGQRTFEPYRAAVVPSLVIALADNFDAYYAKLQMKSPRFCRELARRTRKLAREVGELRFVADSHDTNVIRALMAWKSEKYSRRGTIDRFDRRVDLLDVLLTTRSDCLSGLLCVLYADDQPVAAQFGLRARNLLVGWFIGYNSRFSQYSPGLILVMQMVEALGATEIEVIHIGKPARYKDIFKTHEILASEGVVTSRSVLGVAHRARDASTRWVRHHPSFYRAADKILRSSGVARLTYGRSP
jgi:CelD/BcsL family acetyltransferase involved in cellulose biosynthesis